MDKKSFEAILGTIILTFCIAFTYLILKQTKSAQEDKYGQILYAKFNNIEGIKVGSEVKIGGDRVGIVKAIQLNTESFQVNLTLGLRSDLNLPEDSTISVASSGLLGGKYLNIKPGADDNYLTNGSSFNSTVSAINLEDLINTVASSFGGKN